MNKEEIDNRLSQIDRDVIKVFNTYLPEYKNIATDTYNFGMILRELVLQDMKSQGRFDSQIPKSRIESLLRSEAFSRLATIGVIFTLKWGGPYLGKLIKIITKR